MLDINLDLVSEVNNKPFEIEQKTISVKDVVYEIKKLNKGRDSKRNIISGMNQMIKCKLINENNLAEQFSNDFLSLVSNVKSYVNIHERSKSWPSYLNDIRRSVDAVIKFNVSNLSLSEALYVIAQRAWGRKTSKTKASRLFSELYRNERDSILHPKTVQSWIFNKAHPTGKKSSLFVEFADEFFQLNGELKNKVPPSDGFIESSNKVIKKHENIIIPDLLQSGIDSYINWKVHRVEPGPAYSNFNIPRELLRRLPKKPQDQEWTLDENKNNPGIEQFNKKCRLFVRFLKESNYVEPRYQSHEETMKKFSFVDFFDPELIDQYSAWLLKRQNYTVAIAGFRSLAAECNNNSYVSLFLSKMAYDTLDSWQKYLLELKKYELSTGINELKEAKEKYDKNYDVEKGKRNVKSILDSNNPKKIVHDISIKLRALADTSPHLSSNHLSTLRCSLFFNIEKIRPLRVKNMAEMEYVSGKLNNHEIKRLHEQRKCVLYQSAADGFFHMYVHKNHLKNRKSKKITHIYQPLPALSEQIEHYLTCRQAFLDKKGIESSPWLLCQFKKSKESGVGDKSSTDTLSQSLSNNVKKVTTILYAKNNKELICAINAHGMRHLVATLFLWDHPKDYGALATLLMDDLNTVMNVYAELDHLSNTDEITNWSMQWGEAA